MAKGIIISAPHSGSGKTLVALGLMRAFAQRGVKIAPAKTGPDYIDGAYLAKASGSKTINLDSFAFETNELLGLANHASESSDLLLVEGAMGLFDGGANGAGSSADLAQKLALPIVLVVDCSFMAQSISALVFGYKNFDKDINIAGVILNRVGSQRHEDILRTALKLMNVEVLGVIYRDEELKIANRHLGLILPNEIDDAEKLVSLAAQKIESSLDLDRFLEIAKPLQAQQYAPSLAPLGQHIAIAKDDCFAFIYQHQVLGWREMGAQISFFSPLNNQGPDESADAVFLPGGYPELHAEKLSNCDVFFKELQKASKRDALIYGECGGFMVLGETLIDKQGVSHKMSGLLPITSSINSPKRILGYRYLSHNSPLPFAKNLKGHEFHYSTCTKADLPSLFSAKDSYGESLPDMGVVKGKIMGSYAHVISA